MKKSILCIFLCLAAFLCIPFGSALAGDDAAAMSAEELQQAGKDAYKAKDYEKALEYYRRAAELGHAVTEERLEALASDAKS